MEKKHLPRKMSGKMVSLVGLGFLTLVIINYFFFAKPVDAQTDPASGGVIFDVKEVPQVEVKPCEVTAQGPLTESTLELISFPFTGSPSDPIPTQDITLDFSQLQALFAKDLADYTEGSFQDELHQQTNIASQNSTNINYFFGPSQKLIPRANMDKLRQDYVSYIYYHPATTEANVSYTDSQGKNKQTITQMVQNYGLPRPPTLKNPDPFWDSSWGRYWSKIPTATNDQTLGKIKFYYYGGFGEAEHQHCPVFSTQFEISVPEFTRLSQVSQNLNQLLVPKIVQSKNNNQLKAEAQSNQSIAQKANVQIASAQNQGSVSNKDEKGLIKGFLGKCALAVSWAKNNVLGLKNLVATETVKKSSEPEVLATSTGDTYPCKIGASNQGEGVPFCPPNNGAGKSCLSDTCNLSSEETVNCTGSRCTFHIKPPSFDEDCSSGCEYKIKPVLGLPYLQEIWNRTTYANQSLQNEENQIGGIAGNSTGTPGYLSLFAPSLPGGSTLGANSDDSSVLGASTSQPIASLEVNRRAGKSPDISTVLGASTEGKVAAAVNTNFYPRFIGGTNNFRSFVQFSALSPIPGGAYRPGGQPPGPTPTPSPTPPPSGCDSFAFDGSPGDIQAYVACYAQGKIEPKSGLPLDEVMLGTMGWESNGGHQCAAGTAAEIGVFQYTAETWLTAGFGTNYTDSGSGNYDDYRNGRTNCWKVPGPDPYPLPPYNPNDSRFRWDLQFPCESGGPNCEANAWDPYLQTRATVHMMTEDPIGACRWTGYIAWILDKYGWSPC